MTDEAEGVPREDYPTFLQDFLYVDVARVRSYLGQLAQGVATQSTDSLERATESTGEAGLPVLKGGRSSGTSQRWETTRTLGDLLVPSFEEEATAAGFLRDISDDFGDPGRWESGDVHQDLPVGTVFRYTGPTRLLDPLHVGQLIENFERVTEGLVKFSGGQPKQGTGRTTPKGGTGTDVSGLKNVKKLTEPIRTVLGGLLGGGITIRLFPCGPSKPDCGLGGLLLDRSEYIEPERSAVFARHGVAISDWTVLGVVTRLSQRTPTAPSSLDPASMVRDSGSINRTALEGMMLQMLELLESFGLSEGPAWPSLAMTPLAVYRTIPADLGP
jgi:hypothetical protein